MHKIIVIAWLLSLSVCTGQTRAESRLISKVEKQICSRNVSRIDSVKKVGWSGGYEKITVYLRRNIPIMVGKEEKKVRHMYLTDNTEKDHVTLLIAKFYIIDWIKGDFIRTGTIRYTGTDSASVETTMPKDYIFGFDKYEIEEMLEKKGL